MVRKLDVSSAKAGRMIIRNNNIKKKNLRFIRIAAMQILNRNNSFLSRQEAGN
jgi:hypothetical protein